MRNFLLTLLFTTLAGCGPVSPLFAGGPYKGKVIDAETKAPIVGAVVLAVWYRGAPGLGHASHGFLDAEEVLTDKSGEFTVGEHPPASLIPGTWVDGPSITIFYPNYGFYPIYQKSPSPKLGRDKLNEALEKHAVIEMPPLKTLKEKREGMMLANPVEIPNEKKLKLNRLLNQQAKELGLEGIYPEK
jgi:hypothetical protein